MALQMHNLPSGGQVGINAEMGLYVIPCGGGYSCLGFTVATDRMVATCGWLGVPVPEVQEGTPEAYSAYLDTMAKGEAHHKATGQRDLSGLTPQLAGLEGYRVEVVDVARRDSLGGIAAPSSYVSVRVIRKA